MRRRYLRQGEKGLLFQHPDVLHSGEGHSERDVKPFVVKERRVAGEVSVSGTNERSDLLSMSAVDSGSDP
jgi:hypothetical protein